MRSLGNVRRAALAAIITWLVSASLAGCAVSGDDPKILAVYDDVAYYPACGNEPVTVNGTTYYPLPSSNPLRFGDDVIDPPDPRRYPLPGTPGALGGGGGHGRLGAVAAPGPGDDVGAMVVYSDGVARYESDSGTVKWLTTTPQVYNWVC